MVGVSRQTHRWAQHVSGYSTALYLKMKAVSAFWQGAHGLPFMTFMSSADTRNKSLSVFSVQHSPRLFKAVIFNQGAIAPWGAL